MVRVEQASEQECRDYAALSPDEQAIYKGLREGTNISREGALTLARRLAAEPPCDDCDGSGHEHERENTPCQRCGGRGTQ